MLITLSILLRDGMSSPAYGFHGVRLDVGELSFGIVSLREETTDLPSHEVDDRSSDRRDFRSAISWSWVVW